MSRVSVAQPDAHGSVALLGMHGSRITVRCARCERTLHYAASHTTCINCGQAHRRCYLPSVRYVFRVRTSWVESFMTRARP